MNVIQNHNNTCSNSTHLQHDSVRCSIFSPYDERDNSYGVVHENSRTSHGNHTESRETNCNYNRSSVDDKNKSAMNKIRRKNSYSLFKERASNFLIPLTVASGASTSSGEKDYPLKNNQNTSNLMRRKSSTDFFGMRRRSSTDIFGAFHPIEYNNKNNTNHPNGSANATMNPTQQTSCSTGNIYHSIDLLGIDKKLFRTGSRIANNKKDNNRSNSAKNPRINSVSDLLTPNAVPLMVDSARQNAPCSTSAIINSATSILDCHNTFHSNGSNESGTEVLQPGPYDIVCGRNSGAYNYIGNRRFRVTIEMNLQRYINSPTREDKTNVIKSIVWMLHNDVGARFLKKETIKTSKHARASSGKKATSRYVVMTDKQSREKVGHALRDLVIAARKERQEK